MNKFLIIFLITIIAFFVTVESLEAKGKGFINYDGDTFRATFRIANIDTPEIKGRCPYEINLAEKAKVFTAEFLSRPSIIIQSLGIDKYGRILANVNDGKNDLAELLISAGLGRKWRGRRESWC